MNKEYFEDLARKVNRETRQFTLQEFLREIMKLQEEYWRLKTMLSRYNNTAADVEKIYILKQKIVEETAFFILERRVSVSIYNNKLLDEVILEEGDE